MLEIIYVDEGVDERIPHLQSGFYFFVLSTTSSTVAVIPFILYLFNLTPERQTRLTTSLLGGIAYLTP